MTNYDRMLQLADEVFAVHEDPTQLQVDAEVRARLHRIHPATRSEAVDGDGPVAWVLVIPTTAALMEAFLGSKLTEQELYDHTPEGGVYEAVYLCSAMVLKEYRGQGLAQRLTLEAIENIRKDHPIRTLFYWPFTAEGDALAHTLASAAALPLLVRTR